MAEKDEADRRLAETLKKSGWNIVITAEDWRRMMRHLDQHPLVKDDSYDEEKA